MEYSGLLVATCMGLTIIADGKQYKDTAYRLLRLDSELIVLPTRYANELKNLPASKLSALDATSILDTDSHLPIKTVQKRLIPAIGRLIPRLIDELKYAFEVEFPKCEDEWVAVKPHKIMLRLVSRSSSRLFLDDSICRNEEFLDIVTSYSLNIFETVAVLQALPVFMRPFVAHLLPSYKRLMKQLKYAHEEILTPLIEKRIAAGKAGDPGYEKPDDFLQWMLDLVDHEQQDVDPRFVTHHLLQLMGLAVSHTTSMAMTHIVYDLAMMPEYLETLRDEIHAALLDGWENATQTSLHELKRLDSFMRESQRLNPPGELSFHRVVKEPITLSDGLELPKGTHICMASGPIGMDPDIVQDPEVFDGFRWFRDHKSSSSFISIGPTRVHFGLGRHACPGRFFAAYSMKAILSRILLDYDFKFEPGQAGRPKNTVFGDAIVPNMTTSVLFRKRRDTVAPSSRPLSKPLPPRPGA
ncbi:hypothetical protein VTN02DRAFT_6207 [Thermoascus thermophilus]